MKFSNLKIHKKEFNVSIKPHTNAQPIESTIDFKINVTKDLLKIKPKPTKDKIRNTEPGVKIGTGKFLSISQECNICNKVTGHAHKPEKRKMICLECKTIKTY